MAYISEDGSLLQVEPWGRRSVSFFLGIFHAFFILSLASPIMSMFGSNSEDSGRYDSYSSDFRPGSGPPRPPRRMGRPNTGSNIYTPGPAGGCGCG